RRLLRASRRRSRDRGTGGLGRRQRCQSRCGLRDLSLDHRRGEVARADLEARALRRRPRRLAASAPNRSVRLRELTPSRRAGHGEPPTLSLEPPLHHIARAERPMKRLLPSLLALSLTLPSVIASAADPL